MNQNKAQSRGNVPFSWENKPGIRKETCQEGMEHHYFMRKLTPPPFPPQSVGMSIEGIKISPPPPPLSRRLKKSDDPFLAAYKECTRSTSKGKLAKRDSVSSLRKGIFNFSCKQSCSVENNNLRQMRYRDVSKSGKLFVNFGKFNSLYCFLEFYCSSFLLSYHWFKSIASNRVKG
ncbi:hypothetical protein ES288_D05G234800v1 [Gossypium darwinii]|uniref:Uncharacterized protein n=1 Tax=Gossypium darwinii TaxID=34276 RepID=A0A5D2CIZ0_GOSDA|nr:hypothetical protein ES288_D05G234800v1 [Gossypium darwinii]